MCAASKVHEACYDMLASEARIATFLAIARGELPQQGWFKLARDYTFAFGTHVIISWTGTMFEYLMPSLWMRSYPHTLIAKNLAAVRVCAARFRAFAGHSVGHLGIGQRARETIAATMDTTHTAFRRLRCSGKPRRDRWSRRIPRSWRWESIPWRRVSNLRHMASVGWVGAYGYYEAADYTTESHNGEVVREWMAHHQGMSLLAIVNSLCDDVVQEWFHANPLIQSAELLLHESPTTMADLKAMMKDFANMPQNAGEAA